MKVIHVPRRFVRQDWGGTETVVVNTIRGLRGLGIEGSVFTSKALDGNGHTVIEGVRVERFDYFYPFFGLSRRAVVAMDKKGGNLFSFGLAWALYREPGLSLIHAHTGKRLGGIVRTVARLRNIPYIVSLHGGKLDMPSSEKEELAGPALGAIEWGKALGFIVGSRRVLRDADAIVCVGKGEWRLMKEKYPDKLVEYLPNGVDCKRFVRGNGADFRREFGIAQDAELVALVGRIDPQKDQRLMVRAFPGIIAKRPRAHLLLLGPVTSASYRQSIEELVAGLGLERHVTLIPGFPPGDRRLEDAFHAADVFVLPSRHEPFGIVVLEAWAAGLPVVATAVGGLAHLIDDGRTGLLVGAGDESAIVDRVLRVLSDPALAQSLAGAGQTEALENYDWSVICRRLASIYRRVIDAKAGVERRRSLLTEGS